MRQLVKREPTGSSGPYLSIHRSLQLSILHGLSLSPELRLQIFHQALSLIRKQLPPPSVTRGFQHDMFEKYKVYPPPGYTRHTIVHLPCILTSWSLAPPAQIQPRLALQPLVPRRAGEQSTHLLELPNNAVKSAMPYPLQEGLSASGSTALCFLIAVTD